MRQRPKEQDKFERRHNFLPVEENLTAEQVKEEASRCLSCKNPRCVKGCPVNINIPEFIKALKEDNLEAAGDIIRETSMLPSVCGRVCPQERQCEGNCILGIKGEADADALDALTFLLIVDVSYQSLEIIIGAGNADAQGYLIHMGICISSTVRRYRICRCRCSCCRSICCCRLRGSCCIRSRRCRINRRYCCCTFGS